MACGWKENLFISKSIFLDKLSSSENKFEDKKMLNLRKRYKVIISNLKGLNGSLQTNFQGIKLTMLLLLPSCNHHQYTSIINHVVPTICRQKLWPICLVVIQIAREKMSAPLPTDHELHLSGLISALISLRFFTLRVVESYQLKPSIFVNDFRVANKKVLILKVRSSIVKLSRFQTKMDRS